MKFRLKAILATDNNYVLGLDNYIPWLKKDFKPPPPDHQSHVSSEILDNPKALIKEDMRRFRQYTKEPPSLVVMGRTTYDSLDKPLEGRKLLVLTKQKQKRKGQNVWYCRDILQVLARADALEFNLPFIWVAGGKSVYEQLIPYCEDVFLTMINFSLEHNDKNVIFNPSLLETFSLVKRESYGGGQFLQYANLHRC